MLKKISLWIGDDQHKICKKLAERSNTSLTHTYERIFDEGFTSYFDNYEKELAEDRRKAEAEDSE